jgi:outer membrane lipoprotein-sorting protein
VRLAATLAVLALAGTALLAEPQTTRASAATPLPRPSPLRTISPPFRTIAPAIPAAKTTDPRALLDRISTALSNMQTLVGNFVQVGPDGKRTDGQFYIQKPGKVRFEYNPPSPIDIVADGQSVVVRNRQLATQEPYPLSQTPLRFLLSDHLDLATDANVVSVTSEDGSVAVVIEENQLLTGTIRLKLVFAAKDLQLRQWTVTDSQGFDTTVAVYNLDAGRRLDPDLFKITYDRNLQ